jgi:hypothetical protein
VSFQDKSVVTLDGSGRLGDTVPLSKGHGHHHEIGVGEMAHPHDRGTGRHIRLRRLRSIRIQVDDLGMARLMLGLSRLTAQE